MKALVLSAVLTVAAFQTAHAVIVEIPLPTLAGEYPSLPAEIWPSALVQLPGVAASIHGVSLRVRGTTEIGTLRCSNVDRPWLTQTSAYFGSALPQVWFADALNGETAGEFTWTVSFEPWNAQTTWALLLDGAEPLFLQAGATGYILGGCSPTTPEPGVKITEVTVIVDADFSVPAPASTWGRIKAAYR